MLLMKYLLLTIILSLHIQSFIYESIRFHRKTCVTPVCIPFTFFFFTALFDKPLFNVFFLINSIFVVGPLDEFCHSRRTSHIKMCFNRKKLTSRRNMGVVNTNCTQVDAAHLRAISKTRISRRLPSREGANVSRVQFFRTLS